MDMKNKTCLFCLKQRQILVNNPDTAKAIKNIYSLDLPKDGCRICVECHFNILRVQEFKRTIEAAADFDVDSCFVCKSENTVNEPGVDRVVDYLIKQCTTIDFGKTDTVKACVTCMHVLDTSIKYEKLARNYASAKQFCKQYSTLKECNVALQKIDLDALGEICEGFDDGGGRRPQPKKNRKRARSSIGAEDGPSKKSKQEDGSVLPVMLTKLTPTGGKKASPPNAKGKSVKQSDKIFIKLPLFSKPKKKLHQRKKFGPPHSPSRSIPAAPSVDDLNRIFSVDLRPLSVRIEHIDLSTYLNKTISHDLANRQLRKPKNEEFIGLDEEDVVELQNTSLNSSISKRKSILITERTESPNSAKKKVKFSDSPSIKYVDKLDFSEDENGTKDSDDGDVDYEAAKSKKKTPKPPNGTSPGTPENGKPRPRGKPKRATHDENGEEDEKDDESSKETETVPDDAGTSKKEGEDTPKVAEDAEAPEGETKRGPEEDKEETETEQTSVDKKDETTEDKAIETIKSNETPLENGEPEQQRTDSPVQIPVVDETQSSTEVSKAAPMEAEDADVAEPMKVDQNEEPPTDAEMKAIDSPEDVEMTETKSPTEDVEMKDADSTAANLADDNTEAIPSSEPPVEGVEKDNSAPVPEETPNLNKEQQSTGDFETSDKEEEEMEKFKLNLNSLLGEEISDSDQDASQQSHGDKASKSVADKQQDDPETVENSKSTEKEKDQSQSPNPEAQTTQSIESEKKVPDTEPPSKKNQSFSSLDDVDDISDDDDILDQLDDEPIGVRKQKDSLSESTAKQVTIKMSAVEETSASKTTTASTKIECTELLGGAKTPPTAPISPNIAREDFSLGHHIESTVASNMTTVTSSSQMTAKQQKDDVSGISTPKESVPSGKSSPGLMSVHTGSTDSASKSINLGHSSGIETSESSPKPTSPFPKLLDTLKTDEVKTSSGMSTPDMTRTSTPDMVDSQIERIPDNKSEEVQETITTTTTTTKRYIIKDGEKIEVGSSVKTEVSGDTKKDDTSSAGESMSTSTTTTTTTTKVLKDAIKTPANLTLSSTEDRSLAEEYDDKDVLSPRSDISSGQASRIVAAWHDEDVPGSPMSVTSQAPLSPSTKYTYDYELQHSSSGVSKKSDIEIDDSQDEIPPQYGSDEVKSAITIASAYKPDPMSTSFYGQLPDVSDTSVTATAASTKSVPIPIATGKPFAKTYMEYASSGDSSVDSSHLHKTGSDRKYLDEADLDFEKAFTKSDKVDLMTQSMHFSSEKEFMAATTTTSAALTTVADSSKKELDFTASGLPATVSSLEAQTTLTTTAQSSTTVTSSGSTSTSQQQLQSDKDKDPLASWGKPLGLPSPAPLNDENMKTTPKKERKMILSKTKLNNEKNLRKRSESPIKAAKKPAPVYVDLSYVPHHGNSYYANVEFFKRVRARYYVFSGTEPSREVYNALLEAKQTWEDKELEVTIIPTYDTDVLGYWVSENEDLLAKYHIDLSPSAARCTINLQDHETSCSAYRLEF